MFNTNIDKKIAKVCRRLEKEYGHKIICGDVSNSKDCFTMTVSIQKKQDKDGQETFYNQPIGLIEVKDESKVKFLSINKKASVFRTLSGIVIMALGVFGLSKLFEIKKKWNTE